MKSTGGPRSCSARKRRRLPTSAPASRPSTTGRTASTNCARRKSAAFRERPGSTRFPCKFHAGHCFHVRVLLPAWSCSTGRATRPPSGWRRRSRSSTRRIWAEICSRFRRCRGGMRTSKENWPRSRSASFESTTWQHRTSSFRSLERRLFEFSLNSVLCLLTRRRREPSRRVRVKCKSSGRKLRYVGAPSLVFFIKIIT